MAAKARKSAAKKAAKPAPAKADGVEVEMRVNSWATRRGDVVSVPKATAERLIRNGQAVAVE